MARTGADALPPVSPPAGLRPFLRLTWLPPRALGPIRRVLDNDDEFRSRVGAAATEEIVGRPGWLFLHRPEGWQDELRDLCEAASTVEAVEEEEREERTARRKLAGAEESRRRAEAARSDAESARAQAEDRLAEERRARREAQASLAHLQMELGALQSERDEAQARLHVALERVGSLEGEIESLMDELKEARAGYATPDALPPATSIGDDVAGGEVRKEPAAGVLQPLSSSSTTSELEVVPPSDDVATAVAEAAAAAERLAMALATAAAAMRPPGPYDAISSSSQVAQAEVANLNREPDGPGSSTFSTPAPSASSFPSVSETLAPSACGPTLTSDVNSRRVPLRLPLGIYEESVEAADFLLRRPEVVLLVDGYNATLSASTWGALCIAEQRRRLVDALSELSARTGVDVEVVFDGAAGMSGPPAGPTRRPVKVTFSPPELEADDVVIGRAAQLPTGRPVVVASNDRRVQEGSRRYGANVIGSDQLMALLRARR